MEKINVGMITPWGKNIRCGIRTYSENLVSALTKKDNDLDSEVNVYIIRYPRFGYRSKELIESIIDKIPVNKIDLIHHQNEYGLLYPDLDYAFYSYLYRLGKPIVVTMHSTGDFTRDKIVSNFSSKIIVHNKFCYDKFEGDKGKVVIIPHGCTPMNRISKEDARKILGISIDEKIVGYFGFISPNKGLEVLINAMKDTDAKLLIAGGWFTNEDTDYIQMLRSYAHSMLKDKYFFMGYIPEEKVSYVFGAMDVFVYPARYATESGALLTAISHGKAVIASDIPPFREKLPAIMTFKGSDDLSKKIQKLLDDDEARKKLEKKAFEYALTNSWSKISEKHLLVYENILS